MTGWLSITGVALVVVASLYAGLTTDTDAGGVSLSQQATRTTGNPLITQPGADEFAPGVTDVEEDQAATESQPPAEGQPPVEGQPPAESQPPATDQSPAESQQQAGVPAPSGATVQILNRLDCEKIRGTNYNSPEERTWFLANCLGR